MSIMLFLFFFFFEMNENTNAFLVAKGFLLRALSYWLSPSVDGLVRVKQLL